MSARKKKGVRKGESGRKPREAVASVFCEDGTLDLAVISSMLVEDDGVAPVDPPKREVLVLPELESAESKLAIAAIKVARALSDAGMSPAKPTSPRHTSPRPSLRRGGSSRSSVSGELGRGPTLVHAIQDAAARAQGAQGAALLPSAALYCQALRAVADAISAELDADTLTAEHLLLSSLLQTFIAAARDLLKVDQITIFLHDKSKQQLVTLWQTTSMPSEMKASDKNYVRIREEEDLAGRAFTQQAPVAVEDAYRDSGFDQRADKASGYQTKSVLVVPIVGIAEITGIDGLDTANDQPSEGPRCFGVLQLVNRLEQPAVDGKAGKKGTEIQLATPTMSGALAEVNSTIRIRAFDDADLQNATAITNAIVTLMHAASSAVDSGHRRKLVSEISHGDYIGTAASALGL